MMGGFGFMSALPQSGSSREVVSGRHSRALDPHEPIITLSNARAALIVDTSGQLRFLENEAGVFFGRHYGGRRFEIFARVVHDDRRTPVVSEELSGVERTEPHEAGNSDEAKTK